MTTKLSHLREEGAAARASDGSIWPCSQIPLGIPERRTTKTRRADVSKKNISTRGIKQLSCLKLSHSAIIFCSTEMYKPCKTSLGDFPPPYPPPDLAGGQNRQDKEDSGSPPSHFPPSASQLTGDLAQLRILPRCPTRFVTRSSRPSTPPPFPFPWLRLASLYFVPRRAFHSAARRDGEEVVPTLSAGSRPPSGPGFISSPPHGLWKGDPAARFDGCQQRARVARTYNCVSKLSFSVAA